MCLVVVVVLFFACFIGLILFVFNPKELVKGIVKYLNIYWSFCVITFQD